MNIPIFPEFLPVVLEHHDILRRAFNMAVDGISEYSFANIYLFRKRYNYQISFINETIPIISGERDGKKFFMTPLPLGSAALLKELFAKHDYWKNIPETILQTETETIKTLGIEITEDRDNFDYLYLRDDLAVLSGKKYHKKRNLVNAFLLAYPTHSEKPLSTELIPSALTVLDRWREAKQTDGDYAASREALELFTELGLEGALYYVNGYPAGYCLGEGVANGTIFAMHFEKGLDEYKGIYQYINQHYAGILSTNYTYINREQDLGDEGLRQAKMTYRPSGFVKKYTGLLHN